MTQKTLETLQTKQTTGWIQRSTYINTYKNECNFLLNESLLYFISILWHLYWIMYQMKLYRHLQWKVCLMEFEVRKQFRSIVTSFGQTQNCKWRRLDTCNRQTATAALLSSPQVGDRCLPITAPHGRKLEKWFQKWMNKIQTSLIFICLFDLLTIWHWSCVINPYVDLQLQGYSSFKW